MTAHVEHVEHPDLTITTRQRNLIITGVLVGMLVAAINQTTVTTVLPSIAADLHGLDSYTWVFTANMLASSVAVPVFGKLSDLYGRRALFITGVSVFLAGTIACAVAQSMPQLIGARAVQGIGMGAIMPLAMAILADVVPARERGKWQGLMGAVFGLATVLGPLVGGSVSDALGWRWVFWMNLPLISLALLTVVTQMHIPFVPRRSRIDWPGAVTFGAGLSMLLVALSQGGSSHPWGSARITGMLAGSAALLAAFVLVELRAADPLIPLGLFRDRNVAVSVVGSFGIGAGMFAGVFYVPLFMQAVVGVSSASSGMALIPMTLGTISMSALSGMLITRTGRYKLITLSGGLVGAIGLFLMFRMSPDVSIADASWRMFIAGAGVGLTMQNLVLIAQNSVSLRHIGVVTSLGTLARSVGGTVGIAILGTIFATRLHTHVGSRLADTGSAGALGDIADVPSSTILNAAGSSLPALVKEQVRLGVSDTLLELFLLGIPFMAIAFVACLLIRRDELSDVSAVRVVDESERESIAARA